MARVGVYCTANICIIITNVSFVSCHSRRKQSKLAMQSFRASPWVSYEPSLLSHQERDQPASGSEVDEDVDMDAPRISTLRDDDSPPQHPNKLPKKRPHKGALSGGGGRDVDEFDDEEDQLIDELIDDDDSAKLSPARSIDATQKRKASVKRKSRKGEKKAGELEKKKATPSIVPTISIFKANPTNAEDIEMSASGPISLAESSAPKAKKKVSPRKPTAIPRAMGRLAKSKSTASHLLPVEDAGVLSESYAGTAASSPVTAVFEQISPEPENLQPSSPLPSSGPMVDDPPNLENVPIPIYPLPTKPFPVQPPPKIPTGFAPLLAVDRGRTRVRHWREANREIRGIAGGRWFAKTWVGDKESQFASYTSKFVDDKVSNSKHPAQSSVLSKVVSKLKASKGASVANSANPSRAASVVPEHSGNPVTSAVRAPTKMRISQKAPSDIESAACNT